MSLPVIMQAESFFSLHLTKLVTENNVLITFVAKLKPGFFAGIEIMRDGIYRTSNISQVVDTIVEALTSSSPSDRYLVGIDAKFLLVWLARLPASIADFILHLAFNPPKQQAALS